MPRDEIRIQVPGAGSVSALRTDAPGARWTFVYAPGAGSNMHDPFGSYAARELASHGVTTVRFQFPYMEAGRRGPDRPPVLEATWRAVIAAARNMETRLVAGGRSMGGRIASQVVARHLDHAGVAHPCLDQAHSVTTPSASRGPVRPRFVRACRTVPMIRLTLCMLTHPGGYRKAAVVSGGPRQMVQGQFADLACSSERATR